MNNQTNSQHSVQTKSFSIFGVPAKVYINGYLIETSKNDEVIKILEKFPKLIKRYVAFKTETLKVKVLLVTKSEYERSVLNLYGVDVNKNCLKGACYECSFFNQAFLSELKIKCPLKKKKDFAFEIYFGKLLLKTILGDEIVESTKNC